MLESNIEQACTKYANSRDIVCVKLNRLIGLPDKVFLRYGKLFFVEFKRPGQEPRKIQIYWHELLRRHNFNVYVVNNFKQFTEILDNEFFK